jgi:arsenate reductase (thioredoxin)
VHSPIAEALLNRIDPEHFEAKSAGISYGRMHPLAVEVMNEIGIDLRPKTPKRLQEIGDGRFDYIITLDVNAAKFSPSSEHTEIIHWKVDDPVTMASDPEKQLRAFRVVRDQIAQRLRLFVIVHVRPQIPTAPVSKGTSIAATAR